MICQLKFQTILSVVIEVVEIMICQLKFQTICQFSLRILRLEHDYPVKLSNHLSIGVTDFEIKT